MAWGGSEFLVSYSTLAAAPRNWAKNSCVIACGLHLQVFSNAVGHTKRKMQDRAVKEGFQPLQKAATMPTSPRAPPEPPSVDELRIGDMADLRAQDLSKLYTFAEDREEIYISRLREAVAIKGVSAWVENRPKIVEMLEWAKDWAERLGAAEARFVENPKKTEDATLPPLLLITFAAETNLPHDKVRTVLPPRRRHQRDFLAPRFFSERLCPAGLRLRPPRRAAGEARGRVGQRTFRVD